MSGRRINDHSSWVGHGSKGSVFPEGVKVKHEHSAEGAGSLGKYEDTTEAIHSMQRANDGKMKSHPQKSGYRN